MQAEKTRRIMLSVTPALDRSLRLLGLDPDGDRDGMGRGVGAPQISGTIARYADAVDRASRELERLLTRPEWNMIADLLNGCADPWEWSETPMGSMYLILAQIEDGQRLDGAGDKWLANKLKRGSGQNKTDFLLQKLRGLSQIHGDAILAATRYFWSHYEDVDHSDHKWWTVEYRTRKEGESHAQGTRSRR